MATKTSDKEQVILCVGDTPIMQRAVAMHCIRKLLLLDEKRPIFVHTSNHEDVWEDFGKQFAAKQFCGVSGSYSAGRVYIDDRDEALDKNKECDHGKLLSVLDFSEWSRERVAAARHAKRTDHVILVLTVEPNHLLAHKTVSSQPPSRERMLIMPAVCNVYKAERPFFMVVQDIDPESVPLNELRIYPQASRAEVAWEALLRAGAPRPAAPPPPTVAPPPVSRPKGKDANERSERLAPH